MGSPRSSCNTFPANSLSAKIRQQARSAKASRVKKLGCETFMKANSCKTDGLILYPIMRRRTANHRENHPRIARISLMMGLAVSGKVSYIFLWRREMF
jgi:hypothetical protein